MQRVAMLGYRAAYGVLHCRHAQLALTDAVDSCARFCPQVRNYLCRLPTCPINTCNCAPKIAFSRLSASDDTSKLIGMHSSQLSAMAVLPASHPQIRQAMSTDAPTMLPLLQMAKTFAQVVGQMMGRVTTCEENFCNFIELR